MSETKYEWRGRSIGGLKAETAGEELARIEATHGSVKAQIVVDEARPKESPIHPCFEWRNKIAGEEYRKWQARQLVKCVRVVTTNEQGVESSEPAYYHVRAVRAESDDDSRSGYISTARIVSDLDLFERAMESAYAKLTAAQKSVDELRGLAEKSEQRDKLAALSIAAQMLVTAKEALKQVSH